MVIKTYPNNREIIVPPQRHTREGFSLEDFLNYDDGSDRLYELEDGQLRPMPSESELNRRIATFLLVYFAQLGIPISCLSLKTELEVSSFGANVRIPDLMVFSEALGLAMAGAKRSIVLLDMPPPQLVVEVVSPGKENEVRDYDHKRTQYQARGIEEYWIVDPIKDQVTVLRLNEGLCEETVLTGDQPLKSPLVTSLLELTGGTMLTVAQVLKAGQS
jgi:Uma2 family endonuclease